MTREEAITKLKSFCHNCEKFPTCVNTDKKCFKALEMAIKALEQEPCEDMEKKIEKEYLFESLCEDLKKLQAENENLRNALEQEPKQGHCKDCKWWKDSDGTYRRGVRAESKCLLNTKTVYLGEGFCYKFEPKDCEVEQ